MTHIYEATTVACPYDQVPRYLREYLQKRVNDRTGLELRVPFGGSYLAHDVTFVTWERPELAGYSRIGVGWSPRHGAPYPRFTGTIGAEDDGDGFCRLDVSGTYQPPLGLAGQAFDAALGHRVAEATARDLLGRLKALLEQAYAAQRSASAT